MIRALAFFASAWNDGCLMPWVRAYFMVFFLNVMQGAEKQTFPYMAYVMQEALWELLIVLRRLST